jgi:hypothetical protein
VATSVREIGLPDAGHSPEVASFLACLATVLELPLEDLPTLSSDEDPATGWSVSRWLGGFGLGLVPVADPDAFVWPGPWLARVRPPAEDAPRFVVMFGVPSGVVWDPAGAGRDAERGWVEDGFVLAANDIALAFPGRPEAPVVAGTVEAIVIAASAGEHARAVERVRVLAGQGLQGDRHVAGTGTFPSGLPGSALTLIESEVCASFEPPLGPDEHRRNLVTRGVDLNALVGREFTVGEVRCRGMRLCEPCTVIDGYAERPILRALVHRGGLRADVLEDGEITVGDSVRPAPASR